MEKIKSHHVDPSDTLKCPTCKARADGATGGTEQPVDGSLSICFYCGNYLRFEAGPTGTLTLRELRKDEFLNLPLEVQFRMFGVSQHIKSKAKTHDNK